MQINIETLPEAKSITELDAGVDKMPSFTPNFINLLKLSDGHVDGPPFNGDVKIDQSRNRTRGGGEAMRKGSADKQVDVFWESYDQRAFAINKLSYVDRSTNILSEQKVASSMEKGTSSAMNTADVPLYGSAQVYPEENFVPKNISLGSRVAVDSLNLRKNGLLAVFNVPSPYPIEKSRVSIHSDGQEASIVVRDHFSNEGRLLDSVKAVARSLKLGISRLIINGKEV